MRLRTPFYAFLVRSGPRTHTSSPARVLDQPSRKLETRPGPNAMTMAFGPPDYPTAHP